jgi:serine/threonine protein kinase
MASGTNKRFGRYEIVAELGRGAMGIVYKARDPQIDRLVALKTILLHGQDPEKEDEFRQRFLREAQAAGRLQHPGLVTIYDAGEEEENHDPYIVLEFVNGESLNKLLARERKLPFSRALQLAEEVADALEYAHNQGVVHRDIKPGNILINEDGRAKIADFGIAQLNIASFTMPGQVLGTPAYMAPEQLSGEGVDGRSDIFSVGVLLYAMVTGLSPFHGNSATTVCFKVVNRDPIPASTLDLHLPRELDAVISRAMAKDPAERYQRAAELAQDIHRLRATEFASRTGTANLSAINVATRTGRPFQTTRTDRDLAQARQVVSAAVRRAPIRDLLIGAALVIAIVLLAISTRRVMTPKQESAVQNSVPPEEHTMQAVSSKVGMAEPKSASTVPPPAATALTDPPVVPAAKTQAVAKLRPVKHVALTPEKAPPSAPSCTLELAIDHQFKEATLTVWVDEKLAVTRQLHGGNQKKLVVFKEMRGADSESLQLSAGGHQIRVRAQSSDQTIDLSKTISANFSTDEHKTLQVTFEKHNSVMRLAWQ